MSLLINPYRFAAAGGGGGFTPADLASLIHWHRPEELSGANGDPIGTWTAAEGADFTQATAAQRPTLKSSAINGLAGLDFAGANANMTLAPTSSNVPYVIAVVLQHNSGTVTSDEYFFFTSDGTNRSLLFVPSGTSRWTMFNAFVLDSSATLDGSPHYIVAGFNGSSSYLRIDGVEVADGGAGTRSFSNQYSISATGSIASNHVACEQLVVGADLTAGELADLEAYFATKYAI